MNVEHHFKYTSESPCGVLVYVLDCNILVIEFELQLPYNIHFWTNALGKRYEAPHPHSYVLNNIVSVLQG